MKRKTGKRPTRDNRQRHRYPAPVELVKLINGTAAGLGGAYLLTSSVLIAALAGVLAVALAALYFR
ncbi:MAG TPA: hypothetical protein VFH94_15840 [Streptomyces sp.]|nr:hypothetical protein [Streptomyces sp.]